MPRIKMTDEEREARRLARAEAKRTKREADKAELRAQIDALASQIPAHVRSGPVQVVHAWKEALDAAAKGSALSLVSVDRLAKHAEALKAHVK